MDSKSEDLEGLRVVMKRKQPAPWTGALLCPLPLLCNVMMDNFTRGHSIDVRIRTVWQKCSSEICTCVFSLGNVWWPPDLQLLFLSASASLLLLWPYRKQLLCLL